MAKGLIQSTKTASHFMLAVFLFSFLWAVFPTSAPAYKESLRVSELWMRATSATTPRAAVYVTLHNQERRGPLILKSVEGDLAERIELHENRFNENGVMQMRPVEQISIPGGENVKLKPLGLHIMLIKPKKQFLAGETFTLTFVFDDDQKEIIQGTVHPLIFKPDQ